MAYDFLNFKKKLDSVEEWLKAEYLGIRAGQAVPTLLDSVLVNSYGAQVPIRQIASVSTENPMTLRVSPWDSSQIKDIEKAITDAGLGVSLSTDSSGTRVIFPKLTAERREQLKKVVGEKLEHAKVSVRSERDAVWDEIQRMNREKEMSDDEKFRSKEEMQKMVDNTNKILDSLSEKKEKEIMG